MAQRSPIFPTLGPTERYGYKIKNPNRGLQGQTQKGCFCGVELS